MPATIPRARGEKIICLKNRHDLGLVNGMFLELAGHPRREPAVFSATVTHRGRRRRSPGGSGSTRATSTTTSHSDPDRGTPRLAASEKGLVESVWGYAITCHKAQGSQWENVIVYDDGLGRTAEDRARWLYTAITRAERGPGDLLD